MHRILLLCLILITQNTGATQFAQTNYTQFPPFTVNVVDFNNDRLPDIVAANGGLQVLIGTGGGSFSKPPALASSGTYFAVEVADVNRDGKRDIIGIDYLGTLGVFRGNGDGTFGSLLTYAVGSAARSAVISDFNKDGFVDVAVAKSFGAKSMGVVLGNSSGGFGTVTNFGTTIAWHLATGDFNQDGIVDIATANHTNGTVSIFRGSGNGAFVRTANYTVQQQAKMVVVNDFNDDGKLDLAVANDTDGSVSILLGHGNGTFILPVHYPAGAGANSIAVADMDADGKVDLVVATPATNSFSILRGNGDGTFDPPVLHTLADSLDFAVVADLNVDGAPDIAAASRSGVAVSTFLNLTEFPDPALSISATQNDRLLLQWPSSATAYQLQASSELEAGWVTVSNKPVSLGSKYSWTNSFDSPSKFFRLTR